MLLSPQTTRRYHRGHALDACLGAARGAPIGPVRFRCRQGWTSGAAI